MSSSLEISMVNSNLSPAFRTSSLRDVAQGTENLMPYILDAVRAYCTLGEICGVLREAFGEYREPVIL